MTKLWAMAASNCFSLCVSAADAISVQLPNFPAYKLLFSIWLLTRITAFHNVSLSEVVNPVQQVKKENAPEDLKK